MIERISESSIAHAASLLRQGRLVALPTETVYGLGGDATNERAVAEIFAVKGRPEFNPLIVHVVDVAMAKRLVTWNEHAAMLAGRFWPGPLTMVLTKLPGADISLLVSAGGDTLGIRMPAHEAMRSVITAANLPIAAPSANRSGRVSPTAAEHVREELGHRVPLILDGGACSIGIESTVIDLSGGQPVLLRPGFVTREQLQEALGQKVITPQGWGRAFKSPGMLASHYAPALPVRLNAGEVRENEALLAFGALMPHGTKISFQLSASGDLIEAASRLFRGLRALDTPNHAAIAVMPIPEEGLGVAINDRLRRAAYAR